MNKPDKGFVWVFYVLVIIALIGGAMVVIGLLFLAGLLFEYICAGWPIIEVKESCLYLLDGTLACW